MEDNNLDNLFKSASETYTMDPPDEVWNSLDAQLDQKEKERKNKRGGNNGKRYLLLLLLLLISFSSYFYFSTDKGTGQKSNLAPAPSGKLPLSQNKKTKSSDLTSTVTNVESKESRSNLIINNDSKSEHKTQSPLSVNVSNRTIAKQALHSNPAKKELDLNFNNDNSIADKIKATNEVNPGSNDLARMAGNTREENSDARARGSNEEKPVSNEGNKPVNENSISSELNSSAEITTVLISDSLLQEHAPQPIAETTKKDSVQTQQDATVSLLKKITSRLSLGLFYSPDLAKRYLKEDESQENHPAGIPDYDDYEKPEYSYSGGIKLRYDISDKWSISSGSYYSKFSQSASLNSIIVQSDEVYIKEHDGHDPEHEHDEDDDDHDNGWNNNGNGGGNGGGYNGGGGNPGNEHHHYIVHTSCGTIDMQGLPSEAGSFNSGDTVNIRTEVNESIESISIPLTLRFQVMKNRFAYYAEAGFAVNFVIKNSVDVTIDNTYTQQNKIDGIKNMNYSLLFNAGVQYRLNKWLAVFVEPNIRYSVTPVNEYNIVKMFPYTLGVNTGVTFHF